MTGKTTRKTPEEQAAKSAQDAMEAMLAVGRETMETALKTGVEAAAEGYEKMVAFGKGQIENSAEGYRKAAVLGKENLETFNAVAEAMSAGMEAYSAEFVKSVREATEQNLAFVNKALAVKTPQEFAALQVEAMTKGLDAALARSVELNKITTATMARCVGPLKARFDRAVETMSHPFAA